jgi:hypothetical protein
MGEKELLGWVRKSNCACNRSERKEEEGKKGDGKSLTVI